MEGVEQLEDGALIRRREPLDLPESLEGPGGFRCRLVGSRLEPEQLIAGDPERTREVGKERPRGLAAFTCVVGDHALESSYSLARFARPGPRAVAEHIFRTARRHMTPMPKTDTSQAAAEAQLGALRRLLPERRLALAVDMSLTARALIGARLRTEHPEWSEPEMRRQLLRLTLAGTVLPPKSVDGS